jgi:hypothetical protein
MPQLPDSTIASEDLYGTCLDIYNETDDDYSSIIDEYPDPRDLDWNKYQGWEATDDFVLSDPLIPDVNWGPDKQENSGLKWIIALFLIIVGIWFSTKKRKVFDRRGTYEELK